MSRNIVAGTLLLATSLCCAAPLHPFDAVYETSYRFLSARGERKLEAQPDGSWHMENDARLLMVNVIERSSFTLDNDHVHSLNYEFINPLSEDRSLSLAFDWAANSATNLRTKEAIALHPDVYDKLSYQIQLQMDVCADPDHFPGRDYTVVDRNRLKTYRVELVGREVSKTPAGDLHTIHLRQFRPDKRDGKDTQIWLASNWQCLLVRLDQYDGGNLISLKLVKGRVDGVNVTAKP